MKKWLFTSGATRGSFTAVNPDGEHRDCAGIDLVLGIEEDETVEGALRKILEKLRESSAVPEYLYKNRNLVAYEVSGMKWIKHEEMLKEIDLPVNKTLAVKVEKFETKICQWCGESLPSNGAAQFSHLRKHVLQLVKANILTKDQVGEIRSIKLSPEMLTKFKLGIDNKAFKE
jgi:hypothetical protein